MNKLFHKFQPNPQGKRVGDCVVRALCVVTGRDWYEVYDELYWLGRENCCMPNDKGAYETYLKDEGFKWTPLKIFKGQKRPTVSKFTKEHKSGVYFLSVANHVVGVSNGQYYDSWDSGGCCLYGYWSKEEQNNG